MNEFFDQDLRAKDLRVEAHKMCEPQKGKLAVIYLIYTLILAVCSALTLVYVGTIASLLVTGGFTLSFALISKKVFNNEEVKNDDLFYGFKDYAKAFVLYLLQCVYIFLWSLLFVIPGLIKAFAYSMSFYIQLDNPEMTAKDCLAKSQEMMRGHKWDYFCLLFSYIGWILLSCLTFGILMFWVGPRMNEASYLFYLKVNPEARPQLLEVIEEEVVVEE